MTKELKNIEEDLTAALTELLPKCHLQRGDIFVVGCSTSEVQGSRIGTHSNKDVAQSIFRVLKAQLDPLGVYIAIQCCEHLNRAIVIEKSALPRDVETCNAIPQLHAGGALGVVAYESFTEPTVVESIQAHAGIDIGDTLIGMHLRHVAVPVRLAITKVGDAHLVAARVRPKFIGGIRAMYDESLL